MRLSIIIPAFNEEHAIVGHLEKVVVFVNQQPFESEVLVVDDGSRDQTATLVEEFAKRFARLKLIRHPQNRGKGAAVRTGILAARGEIRGFTDADGSTPIEELERVFATFAGDYDVVIGSRARASTETSVDAYVHRRVMGRIFNAAIRALVPLNDRDGRPLLDTQCGFKWFRAHAAEAIFPRMTLDGFAFDVEALFLAGRLGFGIAEIPVNWRDYGHSHVNLLADPLKMLGQVITIRRRHFKKPVP